MRQDATISIQDPNGATGIYLCPECRRDTSHSIISIVNSHYFEDVAQFWDHYLTVRCNGCGTVSFCHVSKCSDEEDYDSQGQPFLRQHKVNYPSVQEESDLSKEPFVAPSRIIYFETLRPN
jgi:hypothetical protein